MGGIRISVVIPAYNEEANICSTLKDVIGYLCQTFKDAWEIIVVDDGSTDRTAALVEEFIEMHKDEAEDGAERISLLKNVQNTGKGASVRKGMFAAEGEIRLFMDADNSTNIRELSKMLPLFNEGCDIVIASRKLETSIISRPQPLFRRFMSSIHHAMVGVILGTRVSDYNCGFKAFRASVAQSLFSRQRVNRWVFDAEIIFLAKKYGFRIGEIAVTWHHKDTSKVRAIKDSSESFMKVLSIRLNDWRGRY